MKLSFKVLLLIISGAVILSGCGHKKAAKFDFDKYHKKRFASPGIKSIKTLVTNTDSAHPKASEILTEEVAYNDKGWKTKETYYSADSGKIEFTSSYTYDDKGNVTKTDLDYPV